MRTRNRPEVHVTLAPGTIGWLDEAAKQRGLSRSAMVEALIADEILALGLTNRLDWALGRIPRETLSAGDLGRLAESRSYLRNARAVLRVFGPTNLEEGE